MRLMDRSSVVWLSVVLALACPACGAPPADDTGVESDALWSGWTDGAAPSALAGAPVLAASMVSDAFTEVALDASYAQLWLRMHVDGVAGEWVALPAPESAGYFALESSISVAYRGEQIWMIAMGQDQRAYSSVLADGAWSGWSALPDDCQGLTGVAIAGTDDPSQPVVAFATDVGVGPFVRARRLLDGAWTNWSFVPGPAYYLATDIPAVAYIDAGRIEVIVQGNYSGVLWRRSYDPTSGTWSNAWPWDAHWELVPDAWSQTSWTSSAVTHPTPDRIDVYTRGAYDPGLWRISYTLSTGAWGAWESLGSPGDVVTRPGAAALFDGRQLVSAIDTAGSYYVDAFTPDLFAYRRPRVVPGARPVRR